MPLTVSNIVQQKTGSFEGSSGTVSLDTATTAGSHVVVVLCVDSDGSGGQSWTITGPSGFDELSAAPTARAWGYPTVFGKKTSPGGETSWSVSHGGGATKQVCWAVFELTGIDVTNWALMYWSRTAIAAQETLSSTAVTPNVDPVGVSFQIPSFDVMYLAVHFAVNPNPAEPTASAHTNNFQEQAAVGRANASRGCHLSVSTKSSFGARAATSATVSLSPNSYSYSLAISFTGVEAKYPPVYMACFGAQVGAVASLVNPAPVPVAAQGPAPWDVVLNASAFSVVTTNPRSGTHCLQMTVSAANAYVGWLPDGALGTGVPGSLETTSSIWIERFHFLFPTLPTSDFEIMRVRDNWIADCVFTFRAASAKIGCKIGTGSEVLSDAVIQANTWVGVDYRYNVGASTFLCDWQVDYDSLNSSATPVAQAQASGTGGSGGAITGVYKGVFVLGTGTIRFADIAGSNLFYTYPIGRVSVIGLKPDPAGTPSVVGSAANFETFANNGTGTAFNAANVRNALDDWPPTIGSSSDGLMQVNVAVNDYVRVPMATFSDPSDFIPRMVRWYWMGWAKSGNPASIGFRGYDGVSEPARSFVPAVDHEFDDSSAVWMTRIHRADVSTWYEITQAKLDALEARFGWSDDANPDAGVHAVMAEVVLAQARAFGVIEVEGGAFSVYVKQDPLTDAVRGYLVTTPTGSRGATFAWTINGVDGSQYVGPNSVWEKDVGAVDIAEVTQISLTPDPTA